MIELTVDRSAEEVLAECRRRGLVVKMEGVLRKPPGARHWHLGFPRQPGVLELTDAFGEVSLKVAANRDGGWATALARELTGSKKAARSRAAKRR